MTEDDYQDLLDQLARKLAEAVELTAQVLNEKARRDMGVGSVTPLFPGPGEGGNSA
jgi:hypothetical protein